MQKVAIIGNLGQDSVTKAMQSGQTILSFNVAAKSGFGDRAQTSWWQCTLWGKRAEKLTINKGEKVYVYGEVSTQEHEGKTYLKINVQDLELLSPRQENTNDRPPATHGGSYERLPEPSPAFDHLADIPF